jgi:hypothetical protein
VALSGEITSGLPASDFDFLFGRWTIRNRALSGLLQGAHDWCEFAATYECRGLGRLGNIGYFRACCEGQLLEGAGLRLYNPATDEWTLRWADTLRPGAIQPAVTGRFHGHSGAFCGNAFYDARPIRVRVVWTRGTHPRFEQAFSADRGLTWEVNWTMSFSRVSIAAPPVRVPDTLRAAAWATQLSNPQRGHRIDAGGAAGGHVSSE